MTEALRTLVNTHGLSAVLEGLAEVCEDEAEAAAHNTFGHFSYDAARWHKARQGLLDQAYLRRDMPRGVTA